MAGVVPIGNSNLPEQSSKSVYPLKPLPTAKRIGIKQKIVQ